MKSKIAMLTAAAALAVSITGCSANTEAQMMNTSDEQVVETLEQIRDLEPVDYVYYKVEDATLYLKTQEDTEYTKYVATPQIGFMDMLSEPNKIAKVVFEEPMALTNCACLFYNFQTLTEIENINYLDTSHCTDFTRMFAQCLLLPKVDVSHFDTSNAVSTKYMFQSCLMLSNIDVSNWNMSKVESISNMFAHCRELLVLDVSNWNVENVVHADNLFNQCDKLSVIDVSQWNTKNMKYIYNMFYDCDALTTLDISSFNMSNVLNMKNLIENCPSLETLMVPADNGAGLDNGTALLLGANTDVRYVINLEGVEIITPEKP